MEDCIFCKIIEGKIPCKKVFENDNILVFEDINKKAKIHVLIIPKKHIESLNFVDYENLEYINNMLLNIKEVADILGIKESGYRIIVNTGKDSNQEVKHLHFHMLGGEDLGV